MALARTSLAIARFAFVENKLDVMNYDTFGWMLVISTNQVAPNFRKLSFPCFADTTTRSSVTYTSWMSISLNRKSLGNLHFGNINGSLEAGLFKSW